jgi:hypothetical protein
LDRRGLATQDGIGQCDAWLASGENDGIADFCPNATLVAALEGEKALLKSA